MSGLRVVWTTSGKTSLFPKSTSMFQPVVPPRIDDPTLRFCNVGFPVDEPTLRFCNAIPAEVYKAGGLPIVEKLTELFQCMWRKEAIPQDFKDASIIHLYKRKGNPQVCDNHRGISRLSIAGKILAKILLNRPNAHLDQAGLIPESQCGFRKDRGAIDMIFTARQLQEKCQDKM